MCGMEATGQRGALPVGLSGCLPLVATQHWQDSVHGAALSCGRAFPLACFRLRNSDFHKKFRWNGPDCVMYRAIGRQVAWQLARWFVLVVASICMTCLMCRVKSLMCH
jgi:hypothetical protein